MAHGEVDAEARVLRLLGLARLAGLHGDRERGSSPVCAAAPPARPSAAAAASAPSGTFARELLPPRWTAAGNAPPGRSCGGRSEPSALNGGVRATALLASPPRARAAPRDPRPALPPRAAVDQRRAAADGQAARPPGARRVLGLLPRQLAAHAPLRARLARALRGRRPAGDRRAHRRLPAGPRHRGGPGGGGPAGHRVPRRGRRAAGDLGLLRQRGLARAATCGTARARSTRCTTARAPTRRRSARSRRCSGVERAAGGAACAPRTRRACCCPPRRRTSPAPTAARTRPAACGRCWRAPARCAPTGRAVAGRRPRLLPAGRAPAPHRRRARPGGRRRRHLPRHVLHAGGRSAACERSPSRRMSRGGPSASTTTALPGQ